MCSGEARRSVTVEGTRLSKLICNDLSCLLWAKQELVKDRPGAVLVVDYLPLPVLQRYWEDA